MATKHSSSPERRLNRLNAKLWRDAFLAAEVSTLLKVGSKITPVGLAHLAAEYADAAVREFRRRFK
jgi:hypothetical protein